MEIQVLPACFFLNNSFPSTDPIKLIRYDAHKGVICTENKIYELDYSSYSLFFNEINKLETINKIKFMDYLNGHIIIIANELNEFYFRDEGEDCNFIKINILFNENIKQFNIYGKDLFILTKDLSLYTLENYYEQFKDNKSLQFIKIEQNLKIKKMSSSKSHIILLDIFGNIYVKGDNSYGELGLGDDFEDIDEINNFTKVELPFKVKQIFANYDSSYVVNEDNELYGTGFNSEGELGVDNREVINTFTKIVIDNFSKPITLFQCYSSYSYTKFISDDENNIYLCGGETDPNDYDITLEDEDEPLWKFTKIDLRLKSKYLTILPLEEFTLFIGTDYKINNECGEEEESESSLREKCFKVLQNEKLVDVNIYCNVKKRKRNEL